MAFVYYHIFVLATLLPFFLSPARASFPYIPTTLITSSSANSHIHIFQPDPTSSNVQFSLLDASQSLSTSGIHPSIINSAVPFISDDTTAFTPFAGSNGVIYAYAGKCQDGADGASLWIFDPDSDGTGGTWAEKVISVDGVESASTTYGANYLASGMAFSSMVNGTQEMYLFGGMCPNSTNQTVDTWQAAAEYSNNLIALQQSSSSASNPQYELEEVLSRGPPIPEAGFSMTPLSPTFFNSSSGNVTQQQNFVLLGGQTETAFINMSQVALFSLPEETWSFIPVSEPDSGSTSSVDPRSGHTAVLTEDGQNIILFGGWVGDVTSAADPQLAILNIGSGYGGSGEWQWVVPDQSGPIPSLGGLYGHGATMLPGNVLLIYGGFKIPNAPQKRLSKRAVPTANTDSYLFNVSSGSWVAEYTNPGLTAQEQSSSSGSGSSSKDAGLGAGLGIGLALLIGLIVCFIIYRRRRARKRAAREQDLRGLSLGTDAVISPALGFGGVDGRGGHPGASRWISERQQDPVNTYPWAPTVTTPAETGFIPGQGRTNEAERTGLLVEIPSPTRGLRRSLYSRPNLWYEDGRRSRGSGHIHPIDERDEYEPDQHDEGNVQEAPEMIELGGGGGGDLISTAPVLDPFRDPEPRHLLDGSRTPSPISPARERELDMQNWTSDWEAAAGNLMNTGRISPDKSDRTSSTLSDGSSRSMVSAVSVQQSLASISRSISQRSAAIFSSRPLSSSNKTSLQWTPRDDGSSSIPAPSYLNRRSQALTPSDIENTNPSPEPIISTTISPTTAAAATTSSSFPTLQAEGQALLLGSSSLSTAATEPHPAHKRRRSAGSWMGSIRRSIHESIASGSSTGTGTGATNKRDATPSPTRSAHSSPTKRARTDSLINNTSGGGDSLSRPSLVPQRSASAGASLWRRQQGARDWGVRPMTGESGASRRHSQALTMGSSSVGGADAGGGSGPSGGNGGSIFGGGVDTDGEEWDVESAVESRVVQMMFTVPKEKLRVVNAGHEDEEDHQEEDGEGDGEGDGEVGGENVRGGSIRSVGGSNEAGRDKGKGKQKVEL